MKLGAAKIPPLEEALFLNSAVKCKFLSFSPANN